ncbi:hypothetical protein FQA39_LY18013 [Lamprigera yunnana]|nr:hypothetical protein FQA39_LY18013 [Lamprigera yunnana]
MCFRMLLLVVLISAEVALVSGHGRLIEPPSRASAWRYGFNTPRNYNDHELFCGGFTHQWSKNGGKCGICGDAWDSKIPRAHEYGGTYGQGVIVRQYAVGSTITIRVELTASHYGHFTFSLCPDYKNGSQECLDKYMLKNARPQDGLAYNDVRYYPREGSKVYEMKYRLPNLSCPHCILQWRYIAGKLVSIIRNNWGMCPNGTEQVGCGHQEEFRACADITVGKSVPETVETIETATPPVGSPEPEPEPTYSPISAIIITIVSFLIASLIFFLLYFHYYRIGRKIKNWIKRTEDNEEFAPQPPPRIKRAHKELEP